MKPAVIIAEGGNSLEVPITISLNLAAAREYLLGLGFVESDFTMNSKSPDKAFSVGTYQGEELYKALELDDSELEQTNKLYREGSNEKLDHIQFKLFTKYYGGCGECYRLTVKQVDWNTPLVGWDLD